MLALLLLASAVALRLGPLRLALPLGHDQLETGRPLAGATDARAVDAELAGDRPLGGARELPVGDHGQSRSPNFSTSMIRSR
jgi:hypothetical protein